MNNDEVKESAVFINNRVIRVFISSTFRDMQDERDELMKKTFPLLRRKAAERDVTLTELDLRWGITPEESESGKVVEICLREIENSVPFFIGIIGNRYGWIPSPGDLDESLRERFSQVNGYVERQLSVTEMEMQFGVLERAEDMHAFFFIKEQETNDVDEPAKLAALKAAVRSNGRYPVSTYSSPEDLASQVEGAFLQLLDSLFPSGRISAKEKKQIAQKYFLRQLRQFYIRDKEAMLKLDEWFFSPTKQPLCVIGERGVGKSALIANWIEELETKYHVDNCFCYFIGDGAGRESYSSVYPIIKKELETKKPQLLILDGVDHLIDSDDSKRLKWVPDLQNGEKIIFTTNNGDWSCFAIKRRNAVALRLKPLDSQERSSFINHYLGLFGKKLQKHQVDRISSDERTRNISLLKALLDELICYGSYQHLSEKIDWYLDGESERDFFFQIIREYENIYDEDTVSIVEPLLSLLAVLYNGITESDILSITNVKRLEMSRLFSSLSTHLSFCLGSISFSNEQFREAVIKYYSLSGADIHEVDEDTGFRTHWWMSDSEEHLREAIISLYRSKLSTGGYLDERLVQEIVYQYYVLYWGDELLDFIRPIEITGCLLSSEIGRDLLYRCWHWFIYDDGLTFEEYLIDEVFSVEQVDDLVKLATFASNDDLLDDRHFALKVYNICLDLLEGSDSTIKRSIEERIKLL